MKLKAKRSITTIVIAAVICSAALYYTARGFSARSSEAQHLKSVDWLPAVATDISFYRNGDSLFPMYSYECSLPYEAMIDFAREQGWHLEEKSDVHLSGRELLKLPKVKIADVSLGEAYTSAFTYETIQDNGGGILVVYHRPSSRLFVHYSAN